MKRLSFITVCLVAVALTATLQAQVPPHYAEEYEKETGKLRGKVWFDADGSSRQETPREDGTMSVTIVRRDSMTVYRLDMANKTYMAFSFSQLSNPNSMFSMKMEESANTKSEFIGQETVEGKICDHWRYTTTTVLTNGQSETTIYDQWIYKPLNMWIRQTVGTYGSDPEVLRNIAQGQQPANLFEIPRDYRAMGLPAGGIMEMLLGG